MAVGSISRDDHLRARVRGSTSAPVSVVPRAPRRDAEHQGVELGTSLLARRSLTSAVGTAGRRTAIAFLAAVASSERTLELAAGRRGPSRRSRRTDHGREGRSSQPDRQFSARDARLAIVGGM
jgi:hypothetical protein